eukprot:COSAG06_NODE_42013_length_385_cov_1.258741_1_plen_42_part_01
MLQYYIAENLSIREEEFTRRLAAMSNSDDRDNAAAVEVAASI